MNTVVEQSVGAVPPQIGQVWTEQGGVFVGSRLVDGAVHHVIMAGGVETDRIDAAWNDINKIGTINEHSDWRAPDQKELMLAYVNAAEHFDTSDWYWSATPYGSYCAWAVGFEGGGVDIRFRNDEFRVRPFRSIIASSI